MKKLIISGNNYDIESIVDSSVRKKFDIIKIWMRTIEHFITYSHSISDKFSTEQNVGMMIYIDKMSRVFYLLGNKIFSVHFPFLIRFNNNQIQFVDSDCGAIDIFIVNKVLGVVTSSSFEELSNINNVLDIMTSPDDDFDDHIDPKFNMWFFISKLLIAEDGYLRYDIDEARENGDLHPRNHLDIFYDTNNAFKIKVSDSFSHINFLDMLNPETDCHVLNS